MELNQSEVPFTKEQMEQNQSAVPLREEEIEQNQNPVPSIKEMVQNQSGVLNMIEEIEQQLSDNSFKTNVEDEFICRKESLNSNENAVSAIFENLEQEPSVEAMHYMENTNVEGDEQYSEEEDTQEVINGFEMGPLEIKAKIIDSSNEAESRELSLGEDSEDSKKEILKCLVNVYQCPTCLEVFSSRESQEQHKCPTPYRCQICLEVLMDEQDLCKHMLCHKKESCTICGKIFTNKNYYLRHLKAHSGIGYKCVDCAQVFATSGLLKVHRRRHTGEEPYICEFCGKTFVVNVGYQMHLKQHTGEKPFECPTCLKKFSLKFTFHNHIRIHTGERPYVCEICGNCFRDPAGLWRHTKNVHTQKERNFKCHLCPREYVHSTELEAHIGRHTGERPHECHLCGKKYMNKACLVTHIKIHESEKHKCAICKKSFSTVASRNHHIRTHKVETPYGCATCDKTFTLRKDLIKHVFKFQH